MHPANNPNAYVAGLVGAVTSIVLYELNKRVGVNLDPQETSFVAVAVAAAFLFAGRKFGKPRSPSDGAG